MRGPSSSSPGPGWGAARGGCAGMPSPASPGGRTTRRAWPRGSSRSPYGSGNWPDRLRRTQMSKPWHGVLVATALPLTRELAVDYERYAEHVAWLVASGCDGVVPNGSLGEYQTLTPEERARVVRTAAEAIGAERVMPGVAAYGAAEARRWAEQAAE